MSIHNQRKLFLTHSMRSQKLSLRPVQFHKHLLDLAILALEKYSLYSIDNEIKNMEVFHPVLIFRNKLYLVSKYPLLIFKTV